MTGQCGTISPQQYQGARLDNQRRWKWRRARSAMRRNEASDSEFPIRDERPGPRVQRAEEPRRCLPKDRSWVTRGVPSSAHAKEQVKRGKGGQQWYARPAKLFIGGKPCSFNTIRGIADTRRTFETRTKEQGLRGVAAPSDEPSRPGEPPGSKWRVPQNHAGCKGCRCKRRTLPKVEGLLE